MSIIVILFFILDDMMASVTTLKILIGVQKIRHIYEL